MVWLSLDPASLEVFEIRDEVFSEAVVLMQRSMAAIHAALLRIYAGLLSRPMVESYRFQPSSQTEF